ncbi:SDR family NAD(P)-dependent oxidoreductase [Kineococcus radiotolerans]|uniref:Short-chain dehydrogenase/reductase SDR n=1 Tax=Kineococcus radiotolerans (strain ATCC BAA-149 / DSM 14245 / SRS30216) TaxID=266940 RepID=A6WCT7_KINRD|nr:SDR family oxidoreductase [Kineococcus radiotolerans]ABS04626.1 short-chain dehydrogenase/reductase SDR [Kineococcus radiotolerans SRS30216 = ATCC BAA-149]
MPEPTSAAPQCALVTGASRGIGREVALGLAAAGFVVGVTGRDARSLDGLVEEITAAGGWAVATAFDVTDAGAVAAGVRALEQELGGFDLLVQSHGRIESDEVPPWEADLGQVRAVLEANVLGAFHVVRAVVPGMVARGSGRVVDLSSGAASSDSGIHAAYGASKAALFRLGGAIAAAGAAHGVRAFELSPGVVRTAMATGMGQHAERTEWTDPADVVAMVLAIAAGELDGWSGRYLRVGVDTPGSLLAAEATRSPRGRRLVVEPYGEDDPLHP